MNSLPPPSPRNDHPVSKAILDRRPSHPPTPSLSSVDEEGEEEGRGGGVEIRNVKVIPGKGGERVGKGFFYKKEVFL